MQRRYGKGKVGGVFKWLYMPLALHINDGLHIN